MAEPVTTDSTTNLTILAEKTITACPIIYLRIRADSPLATIPLFAPWILDTDGDAKGRRSLGVYRTSLGRLVICALAERVFRSNLTARR